MNLARPSPVALNVVSGVSVSLNISPSPIPSQEEIRGSKNTLGSHLPSLYPHLSSPLLRHPENPLRRTWYLGSTRISEED